MNILKKQDGNELHISVAGRLDTTTAPELAAEVNGEALDGITALMLDFAKLDYISSAGLRVLLAAQKIMNKQGSMVVKNVNEAVAEVFEITGFSDILAIQ